MYSRKDRTTAIELWLKYDKNLAAVVRELGYPSTKMLGLWCKAYLREKETGVSTIHGQRPGTYSAEQKNVAVEYYFSHGRCLARTIRAVGYPCRELLAEWCKAVEPARRTQSRNKVYFSNEQKQEAVIALCSRTGSAKEIAGAQGVTRTALYNWKDALLGKGDFMAKKKSNDLPKDKDQLLSEIAVLEKQVQHLKLEKDILEAAVALIKKDPGVDLNDLSNRDKTVLIGALKYKYSVKALLVCVGLSRSSYYYQRWAMSLEHKYTALKAHIEELFEQNNRCYGYRRIHELLTREGIKVSEKVVRMLMGEASLIAQRKHARKYSSYQGEITPAPENLLERDFHAEAPNQKWLTDITEFRIPAGKVYLSPVVDCFDGMLVSWTISTRPDAGLVTTMLDLATDTLHDGEFPIIHTDRGCHYRWPGWLERTENASLVRSMSKKGCSPDNAACEGLFGRIKNEMFYNHNWIGITMDSFIETLDKYLQWYNTARIKMSLGGKSPVQYRLSLAFAA
jgi:transposase InsO family protein/transposase-like protein